MTNLPTAAARSAAPPTPTGAMEVLRALAAQAATAAGAELLARFRGDRRVTSKRTRTDLVSDADRVAEDTIVELLVAHRPGDGVIAEEGSRRHSTTGISWVVDPLDGTTNYLYGDHEWSVSVAAVDSSGTLAAAVLAPTTGRLFTATRGGGAWEGQERLSCSGTDQLALALVLAGLDYDARVRRQQMAVFTDLTGQVRDIRRHGSAALELCRVAEGSADAYLESPIQWWDIAAGVLIAEEAGAVVAADDLGGPRRSVFASAPGIDAALRDWLLGHAPAFAYLAGAEHARPEAAQ